MEDPDFRGAGLVSGTGYVTAQYVLDSAADVERARDLLADGYAMVTAVDADVTGYSDAGPGFAVTEGDITGDWTVNHANTVVGYDDGMSF